MKDLHHSSRQLLWTDICIKLNINSIIYHVISIDDLISKLASKWFRRFSDLSDSQKIDTTIMKERTGVAVLCCHGKSISKFVGLQN